MDNDSEVVLYDDGPGAFAARAWWLLVWLGKQRRGDPRRWPEGLACSAPAPEPGPCTQAPRHVQRRARPRAADRCRPPAKRLGNADLTLIDARALPRFRGEVEPIDPVAGHIPGAQCAAFTDNLGPDGRFLPADQLRQRCRKAGRAGTGARGVLLRVGVTACHNLFALALAGYPLGKLYAGSWSEWITDPKHGVATGE